MLIISSCEKEDESASVSNVSPNWNIADPNTIVSSMEVSKIVSNGEEYNFTYDSNGKLVSVISFELKTMETLVRENKGEFQLDYTEDKLTSIKIKRIRTSTYNDGSVSTGSLEQTSSSSYNERGLVDTVTKVVVYSSQGNYAEYADKYIFDYDSESRLIRFSTEGVHEDVTYEWSGQNIVKEHYHDGTHDVGERKNSLNATISVLTRGSMRMTGMEREYILSDFDNTQNPRIILALINGFIDGGFISKNNARKISLFYMDENGKPYLDGETVFTIEYDNKGRAVKYTDIVKDAEGAIEDTEEMTIVYKN